MTAEHEHPSMAANTVTDLDWLAARYVLGELSADEVVAFEERLQLDLLACEAVVQATRVLVEIAELLPVNTDVRESVAVAPAGITARVFVPTPANRSRQGRGWWVVSLVTAALVLLTVGLQFEWNPRGDQRVAMENSSGTNEFRRLRGEEARVAANLLGSWRTIDVDMIDSGLATIDREAGSDREANSDHEEAAEGIDENSVPDWMIAALLADQSEDEANARPVAVPNEGLPVPGPVIQ